MRTVSSFGGLPGGVLAAPESALCGWIGVILLTLLLSDRPNVSRYGAPILFERKKEGSLRMCGDYRAMNKQTVKVRYPLPRTDELLNQSGDSGIYYSLVLIQGL